MLNATYKDAQAEYAENVLYRVRRAYIADDGKRKFSYYAIVRDADAEEANDKEDEEEPEANKDDEEEEEEEPEKNRSDEDEEEPETNKDDEEEPEPRKKKSQEIGNRIANQDKPGPSGLTAAQKRALIRAQSVTNTDENMNDVCECR